MALVECEECAGKMSNLADACPHCGRPNDSKRLLEELAHSQGALDYYEYYYGDRDYQAGVKEWIEENDSKEVGLYLDLYKTYYEKGWEEARLEDEDNEDEDEDY